MSWGSLNKRQQTYLKAVFEVDQAQEANIKAMGARGHWNSTPASVWRWMPSNAAGAALLRKINDAGYVDQGTGSTFAALERRGLVLCKYESGSLGGPILFVQITQAGRKLVREALNGVTLFFRARHTLSPLRCLLMHTSHHLKCKRCQTNHPLERSSLVRRSGQDSLRSRFTSKPWILPKKYGDPIKQNGLTSEFM